VNLFLQCRAITSLPWKDLGEAGLITIYIGHTLTREVDRLKGDGNQRRAKRARDTNSLFRKLLREPNKTIVLQEAHPRVILTFLPHLDPHREKSPWLDLSNPDDCHIEQALAFRATHSEIRTAILTHDTGPMLTAERVGLEPLEIPDNWLLEPEKDERQKQIEELTRQVKLLQTQHAHISISARDEHGAVVEALTLSVVEYEAPEPELIASVLADLRARYPRKDDFSKAPPTDQWSLYALAGHPSQYQPPSPDKIDQYHRDYERWLMEAEAFLNALPEQLMLQTCHIDAVLRLENIGTKTARSVQIDFVATPGFLLRPPSRNRNPNDKTESRVLNLPRHPEPPEGKFIDPLASWAEAVRGIPGILSHEAAGPAMNIASFLQPEPHDPTAFYYRDGRPSTFVQDVSLTCMHFRHRLDPEDFEFKVRWQPEIRSRGGAIRCRVSAENLPEPIEYTLPIRVTFERGDIAEAVERLRPAALPKLSFRPRRGGSGSPP
jgi:hypothetical protein